MQLTLNLTFEPAPRIKAIFRNSSWIEAGPEIRMIGFTQPLEFSQAFSDALRSRVDEEEEDYEQRLYDALWLAHHYLTLNQRPSFSFTFDYLRDDKFLGRLIEESLRLHLEVRGQTILLGLPNDF